MSQEKRQPFHKSVLDFIKNATAVEMEVIAQIIHITQIPANQNEILKAWKHRCHELKCPDHGITERLHS